LNTAKDLEFFSTTGLVYFGLQPQLTRRVVAVVDAIWSNVVKITDPNKPFYSHRHTATSYLRNTRLPDGSPAVKEDIERYILGHAGKGAHAGYGKRWFETLKGRGRSHPEPARGFCK